MENEPEDDLAEGIEPPQYARILERLEYLTSLFQRRLQTDATAAALSRQIRDDLDRRAALETGEAHAALFSELVLALDAIRFEDPESRAAGARDEILTILERRGLEPIDISGPLDPHFHEVVGVEGNTGETASGTIIEVVRPGYRLGNRVLRTAHVVVTS